MIIETDAGVEHETAEGLLVKHIDRLLIEFLMVGIDFRFGVAVGVASVEFDVDPAGQGAAHPGPESLEGVESALVVGAVEEVGLRLSPLRVAVVDVVPAPVVIEVDAAVRALIVVLQGDPGHQAEDVGGAIEHRFLHGARVLGVGVDEIHVAAQAPGGGQVIGGLQHPAGGAEGRVLAVAGGAVVAHVRDQREAAV